MAKAKSKGEKNRIRRARGGRPRKLDVKRYKDGNTHKSTRDQGPVYSLIKRQEIFDLTEEQARDQKAGTVMGAIHVLARAKKDHPQYITPRQHEACQRVNIAFVRYHAAIGSPKGLYNPPPSPIREMTPEQVAKYKKEYNDAMGYLIDFMGNSRIKSEAYDSLILERRGFDYAVSLSRLHETFKAARQICELLANYYELPVDN